MKKKAFGLLLAGILTCGIFTGCSFEDETDNFNIYRKIKILNSQSGEVLMEFEGWCSIYSIAKDNTDNQLEITYRVGKDKYYKDFVGLNDRTTYLVTQIDGANVDKYHYKWVYHSKGDLIPIKLTDNDAEDEE